MKRLFSKKKRKKQKEVLHSSISPMNPKYQYAIKEYHQTVGPYQSNDSGQASSYQHQWEPPSSQAQPSLDAESEPLPMAEASARRSQPEPIRVETVKSDEDDIESVLVDDKRDQYVRIEDTGAPAQAQQGYPPQKASPLHAAETPSVSHPAQSDLTYSGTMSQETITRRRVLLEPEMPDTTYEEQYGDAYIDAPIKYIYPSGYQSMRPRSGPWKLSISILIFFTWLSVFIVGHCSDRVDESAYYYANEIDDDTLVIETRWCGSRPLYIMWVFSMLITGLAAAYCSVIGYIKARDFAVANGRNQPPDMVGKTDYYVRITDDAGSVAGSVTSLHNHSTNIYQSDGTPQFWGSHIYRPTQAAVAVTSR